MTLNKENQPSVPRPFNTWTSPISEGAESADEFVGDDRQLVDDLVSDRDRRIIYCLVLKEKQASNRKSVVPACSIDDPTTLQSWIEPKARTSPLPRLLMITPATEDLQRRIHFHGIESAGTPWTSQKYLFLRYLERIQPYILYRLCLGESPPWELPVGAYQWFQLLSQCRL